MLLHKQYLQKPILNMLRNTTCDVTNMHSMEIDICQMPVYALTLGMVHTKNGRQIGGVPDCHMTWL